MTHSFPRRRHDLIKNDGAYSLQRITEARVPFIIAYILSLRP